MTVKASAYKFRKGKLYIEIISLLNKTESIKTIKSIEEFEKVGIKIDIQYELRKSMSN